MAATVDIQDLVEIHIRPVLSIDDTLQADLPSVIASQIALQGWTSDSLTDKQAVYCAAATLEALLPRLTLIYTDEVQENRTGPEHVKLPDRARFFATLQKAIDNMKVTAERGVGIGTAVSDQQLEKPWPGVGLKRW